MKIKKYSEIQPAHFDNDTMKGIAGQVATGKKDGAKNYCISGF